MGFAKNDRLSDHAPVLSRKTDIGRVLTFNILTQARAQGDRVNNGFGINESSAQYRARLHDVAQEVMRLSRYPEVTVVALQEAPVQDAKALAVLTKALGPEWKVFTQVSLGNDFGTLTAVRSKDLDAAIAPALALGEQTGRVQLLTLTPKSGGAPVRFANVHLDWAKGATADLEALLDAPRVVIAGDFNRDPDDAKRGFASLGKGARIEFPKGPTSVAFGKTAGTQRIDGFITRGV